MPFRSWVTIFLSAIFLLARPACLLAQPTQRDDLRPDFSAGFQLPSRDPGLLKEGRDKKPASSWRQYQDGASANSRWAGRSAAQEDQGSAIMRLEKGQIGPSVVLRRRPLDAATEHGSPTNSLPGVGVDLSSDKDVQVPAARVPADLRGGYGAVLKGRPVTPEQP